MSRCGSTFGSRAIAVLAFASVMAATHDASAVQVRERVRESLLIEHPGRTATSATPQENARLAVSPAWRNFRTAEGRGWQAIFNPVNGAPHRAWGSAIGAASGPVASDADAEGRAREFIATNAELLTATDVELSVMKNVDRAGRRIVVFQQVVNGVPVEGGRADIRLAADGRVTLFGSDLYPGVRIGTTPSLSAFETAARVRSAIAFDPATGEERGISLRILPIVRPSGTEYRLAWRSEHFMREEPALWITWVDAMSGEMLWRYDDLKYETMSGTVDADVQIVLPTDPYSNRALERHIVTVTGQGSDTTDTAGAWSVTVPSAGSYDVTAQLRGPLLNVNNSGGSDASFAGTFPSGTPLTVHWNDANSQADERDTYFHAHVAHDSIKSWDPTLTDVDYAMPCAVSINDECNAFWDGTGINFFAAGGGCDNTGQMPDVVYHEYGHGITQFTYAPANCPGDQHEGFSDYFAATVTDQPVIGRGFFGPGTQLRTLDNSLVYPDDISGESHHDGLIVGGALWHMRQRFITSIGNHTTAVALADSLFHFARYGLGANFNDYFLDLAMEDDDDGDLGNGTPHGIDIYAAFGQHGIGPGLHVTIDHDSLKDSEAPFVGYSVFATITSVLPLDADSLRLHYRSAVASGGPWSAWTSVQVIPAGPAHYYSGTIPGQPSGTAVQYYLSAKSDTLGVQSFLPAAGAGAPFIFFVGPDQVPPVIVHTPIANQSPADWPPTVTAIVTDNLGLASVVVEYRKNGVVQPTLGMSMTTPADHWTVQFPPGVVVAGDVFEYRIKATDTSVAANVGVSPYDAWHRIYIGATVTVFNDTIESGAPGWTHYVGEPGFVDQWHISTNRNHTPGGSRSWKFGATGIFNRYANSACGALQSPPVVLGDHPKLSFWHWIRAEQGDATTAWDGGILEMTRNGGSTWELVSPQTGGYTHTIIPNEDSPFAGHTPCWSGSFDWRQVVLDLSGITGTVSFRWRFGTDAGTTDLGWHVDDVMVTGVTTPTDVAGGATQPAVVAFALEPARPNPFGPETAIRFAIPAAGRVDLAVFDVSGRLVRTLMAGDVTLGEHVVRWDGRDDAGTRVAPGVYFYRVDAGEFTATRKMTVTR